MLIKRGFGEGVDRFRDIGTGGLDWYVVVLFEVDTSLLFGRVVENSKELALDAWVGWASNMLAVHPLTISRAGSVATASAASTETTTCSRVSIGIGVELSCWSIRSGLIPALVGWGGGTISVRGEVRGFGPRACGLGRATDGRESRKVIISNS